jgi:hemerythrin-like metal-binding protein
MSTSYLPPTAETGLPEMDTIHGLVLEILEKTIKLPEAEFAHAFTQVVKAIEVDFRREEQLMDSFQCPNVRQHREQHARMQAGLHHAAAALARSEQLPARQALTALRDWLPFHIATQDRHLVRFLRSLENKG